VVETPVTLKRYYTLHPGHQKKGLLKTFYSEIKIFLKNFGKVCEFIFMSQRPFKTRVLSVAI
jgi:hypothetical protein